MAETTHISWGDSTFNPWIGCTKVSPACDHCYAEVSTPSRTMQVQWGNHPRHRTSPSYWKAPLNWNRKAALAGTRPFVFGGSLCDVFDNQVDPQWRADYFELIRATPHLVWLLLTKRPQNIERMSIEAGGLPTNAAIGCTVVTQIEANRDIPILVRAKHALGALFAFLSMEPLVELVDLDYPTSIWPDGPPMCCSGFECGCMGKPADPPLIYGIDWVLTGGESDQGGQRGRPAPGAWFREVRDVCAEHGVAYQHKQNGEFVDVTTEQLLNVDTQRQINEGSLVITADGWPMRGVGKKVAGRLLDGVLHDARPALPELTLA